MKIGCDPEIFLMDASASLVSAIDKIGGTKAQPRPLRTLGDGFAVQEDNVALEFNIPPASSKEEFKVSLNKIKNYLREQIAVMNLDFNHQSAAIFPMIELAHPKAMEFGCDPDFNAWMNGAINPRPKADDWRLRSCGGHVHIGEDIPSESEAQRLIKFMDFYAGVPSVVLDNGHLRKKLYGKRGAYRLKPYGVEYRTLSNFWIWDDKLIEWVWNATQLAVDQWKSKKVDHILTEEDNFIKQAIDENNLDAANYLIDKYKLDVTYA